MEKYLEYKAEAEDPILLAKDLKCQIHPPDNSVMSAFITNAVNPWEFYVLPKYLSWSMDSTEDQLVSDQLRNLAISLNSYYRRNFAPILPGEWKIGQLVAVAYKPVHTILNKVAESSDRRGRRGLEDDYYRAMMTALIPNQTNSMVKIFLIDIGITRVVPLGKLSRLRMQFVELQPLAYTCRLHGVSPIGPFWNDRAIEIFNKSAFGQDCIVNVISKNIVAKKDIYRSKFQVDETVITVEEQYYVVELRLQEQTLPKNKTCRFESMTEMLVKGNFGLAWNAFPNRPSLTKKVSTSSSTLLFDSKVYSSNTSGNKDVEDKEEERLIEKLESLHGKAQYPQVLVSDDLSSNATENADKEDIVEKMEKLLNLK